MPKSNLTDKQKMFLNALYEDAKGDIRMAMDIAGYAKATSIDSVIEPLADEIVDMGRRFMAVNVPKAAIAMVGVIDEPTMLGGERKIAAAKEVMDRAGLVKREKIDVGAEGISGIFFLPAKKTD
jgi:hypothetical protein